MVDWIELVDAGGMVLIGIYAVYRLDKHLNKIEPWIQGIAVESAATEKRLEAIEESIAALPCKAK